jgi:hypothetical protein
VAEYATPGLTVLDAVTSKAITTATTLYVTTAGNDSTGDGTVGAPYLTIQKALDSLLAYRITAVVTISVGAGNFAGFVAGGYNLGVGGAVHVEGTMTVIESGTATAFSVVDGYLNIEDNTKTWVADEHQGRFAAVAFGAGALVYLPIGTNSATQMSIATNNSSLGGNTAYSIAEPATKITTASSAASGVGVYFTTPSSGTQTGVGVLVRRVEVGTGLVATARWGVYANLTSCTLRGSVANTGANRLECTYCSFLVPAAGRGISSTSALTDSGMINAQQCVFVVGTSGIGVAAAMGGQSGMRVSLCQIRCGGGTSVGFHVCGGQVTIGSCGIWGAATGLKAERHAVVDSPAVPSYLPPTFVGSGNTLAVECLTGARVTVGPSSTLTGTTEISVDGATSTIAAMRALTPKVFPATPNAYGSYVCE